MKFGFETNITGSINCAESSEVYSLEVDLKGNIWIGSNYGLIKYNSNQGDCEVININSAEIKNGQTVYSTRFDGDLIWVAGSIGLLKFNRASGVIVSHSVDLDTPAVYFSHKLTDEKLLIGTASGLFEYNLDSQVYTLLEYPKEKYRNITYDEVAVNLQGEVFLPTTKGVLYLDKSGQLNEFEGGEGLFADIDAIYILISTRNQMFISVRNGGVYHLNADNKIINHYSTEHLLSPSTSVDQIIVDESSNTLWLGSEKGIIYIDLMTQESHLFSGVSDENYFLLKDSSYQDANGKIYFAGSSGYVSFYPKDIKLMYPDSNVIINELYLMNAPIRVGVKTSSGFVLNTEIENTRHLDFSYKDKIIGFEFIKLNYNNPTAIKYKYKLEPISSNWMELLPGDRSLTFTNLKAGKYNLFLRATNVNREWDADSTSLSFTVNAPPWLTLWAFLSYILILILLVFLYIHKKTQTQKKLNEYLNAQVKEQTKHIQKQKQTVEDLMARKNEIFSNVSHEFRTPITLILGPVEELQKEEKDTAKKESFAMIARNAKRLLNLVNQMLKLSQIAEMQKGEKEIVNVASILNLITEPFIHLTNKSNIELIIEPFADVKVKATEGAFETTIGNFLSNANKYTSENGKITIGTHINGNRIEIYVKDSGCGISAEEQKNVFRRFNRLAQHGSIQGVGIGLALVQEVAELNDAELSLESEVGTGSKFSISFPIYKTIDTNTQSPFSKTTTELHQLTNVDTQQSLNETVLIIEDNDDMRSYINSILSKQFNCILAVDGTDGIAKALKQVPDIIVCDVMMPGMNGFQVCRRLRNEMVTSHIPLVLLTALDEKSSRIKGWRENIDMYLNKPFDATELVLQLRNILNIRNIIAQSNENGKSSQPYSSLSEIDQKFIEKLNAIVTKEYANPLLNLEKIASLMFVSDRQLQRKTKALINKSPMDFIREVRLKKAAQILNDGYQISIASDKCGFSSVSYFSQSFKKHYGLSPKEYQMLNKEHK
ncbi:MAG: response regulator [Alcanivoracaceae bacterium]|nr:response regulator [Alcanivoracaceae bacterium]